MNVTSAALTAPGLGATNAPSSNGSPLATLLNGASGPSTTQSAKDAKGSAPGPDVAKKLKALGEQYLAVMLIQDPAARAKAAAGLYKQYAETAKEYAGATADGRAAAQAASAAYAADPASIAGKTDETGATAEAVAATTSDSPATDASPSEQVADAPAAPLTDTPAATDTAVTYMPGRKSNFAADLYMEQIKMFANATHDAYEAAVEEAKRKKADKGQTGDLDKGVKADHDTLEESAKAVEGSAATAEGYDPVGAALGGAGPPAAIRVVA